MGYLKRFILVLAVFGLSTCTPSPVEKMKQSNSNVAGGDVTVEDGAAGGANAEAKAGANKNPGATDIALTADGCMKCHNGSEKSDYAGAGMENPHPFKGASKMLCSTCHGGDPDSNFKDTAHVPPPPQIGTKENRVLNPEAHFNKLTLTGIDKYPDYEVNGKKYTAIDYLQFINPGDLRVGDKGKGCGMIGCHGGQHSDWVPKSPIATLTGFFSGNLFFIGSENTIPEHRGKYSDTAGEFAFRAVKDDTYKGGDDFIGRVGRLEEFPTFARLGDVANMYNNDLFDSTQLGNYLTNANSALGANRVVTGSPLFKILGETTTTFCGTCHLGTAGINNRYADFRSSGCTSCHMEYALDGRSTSFDPHINKYEPLDPDNLAAGERPHVEKHLIRSVAQTNSEGVYQAGISDRACVGCHRGSGRTVWQYWGIRLDANQELVNNTQYPANPVSFLTATGDKRLFDPAVGNNTFTGANANQLIVFEDYDGDGRDDTPADVHYEAGMGCIDCHSSRDMHGGVAGDKTSGYIVSRQEQNVFVRCESCHGKASEIAETKTCTTYTGGKAECAMDSIGNPMRHVTKNKKGEFWLVSRLNNKKMYVKQTYETVVNDPKKINPVTGKRVYNPLASFAMGRADGNQSTGLGPMQKDAAKYTLGFSHDDNVSCAACHSAWTNSCNGCHVTAKYNADPANFTFDKIRGERSVMDDPDTNFGYQSGLPFYLGIDTHDKVASTMPMTKMFYKYIDKNGVESAVLTANDRNGNGNNPGVNGRGNFPSLGHQKFSAHSIRGAVTPRNEGARNCVACHMTQQGIDNFGAQYQAFRNAMNGENYNQLDFNLLQQHFGQNPGNQLNSPFFSFSAAGLGSGLFIYDATGCPLNPLDNNANRQGCNNGAPANNFNNGAALNNAVYNIDRIVEPTGVANGSSIHPLQTGEPSKLRDGSLDPKMSGPLGSKIINMMTNPDTGLVLDSWIDADGQAGGQANDLLNQ